MEQVSFYQLSLPLAQVLPRLLEKVYEKKERGTVLLRQKEEVDFFDTLLWTYSKSIFLPHGSCKKIPKKFHERQPLWLATDLENVNHSSVLILVNETVVDFLSYSFQRCLDLFPKEHTNEAYNRCVNYQNKGLKSSLWIQDDKGKWHKRDRFLNC